MRDEPLQLDATNLCPPSSSQYSIEFGRKVSLDSGGNEGPGDSTRVFDLDGRFASYPQRPA